MLYPTTDSLKTQFSTCKKIKCEGDVNISFVLIKNTRSALEMLTRTFNSLGINLTYYYEIPVYLNRIYADTVENGKSLHIILTD